MAHAASGVGAQESPRRTPVVDVTMARHTIAGGFVDYRTGALLDVLIAGDVRPAARWTWIAAGGVGGVLGGFGDRCLFKPDGGCAPQANFVAGSLLGGVHVPLSEFAVRALAGPALYSGADARSVGLQGRLDLLGPTFLHLGLGAMARATLLPSHGGDRLVAWALGGSLVIR